jgi:murein L,D-transpeptidase YcbB/YkuD
VTVPIPEPLERPPAMRRAALCLASTLALAASLPALAQDTSQPAPAATQQPATAEAPAADPIVTSSIPGQRTDGAPAASAPSEQAAPAKQDNNASTPAAAPSTPAGETTPPPAAVTTPAAPATDAPATATPATPAPSPAAPALATPAPVETAPAVPPLQSALLRAIESSKPAARQGLVREWNDAISAFYTARQGKPVWMTDAGMSASAQALVAEIGRADEWGLDVRAFDVDGLPAGAADADQLATAELKLARAVLTYAWHARGGRVDPSELSKWLDQSPRALDVKATLDKFAASSDPSVDLQKLHPQHRQFELLRRAYLNARAEKPEPMVPARIEDTRDTFIPDGPTVRLGDRHPHVELVRRRLGLPTNTDDADLYDEEVAAAVREHIGATYRDSRTGKSVQRPKHPALTNSAREALSRKKRAPAPTTASSKPTLKQYLVNLERWRWMPEQLGPTHIWNNLPEYTTRVIRNGSVIHQERIIIGKPTNQTPVFSDEMQFVVFHPDWGVPGTIKVQDLLPSLQAGDDSVLRRRNMRLVSGNRTVHPAEVDWSRTDIRKLSVIQDPGPSNPLGQLKFMFPNKHDVYMHDTPTKNLFETPMRAYSFGCIRVRNPVRLAELVFGQDRNWTQTDITPLLSPRAAQNNRVNLNHRIPVHNTYFTLLADESGKVTQFADVYGHDKRIQAVLLDGERVDVVARTDPALALDRKVKELANAPPRPRQDGYGGGWGWGPPGKKGGFNDFFGGLFGN